MYLNNYMPHSQYSGLGMDNLSSAFKNNKFGIIGSNTLSGNNNKNNIYDIDDIYGNNTDDNYDVDNREIFQNGSWYRDPTQGTKYTTTHNGNIEKRIYDNGTTNTITPITQADRSKWKNVEDARIDDINKEINSRKKRIAKSRNRFG